MLQPKKKADERNSWSHDYKLFDRCAFQEDSNSDVRPGENNGDNPRRSCCISLPYRRASPRIPRSRSRHRGYDIESYALFKSKA
jgi:hypothetical protein